MDVKSGIEGFGQYGALRKDLRSLQMEFAEAAGDGPEGMPSLGHQLISPLNGPLTPGQWSAFKSANSDRDGDWQKWDDIPGGGSCGRFFGNEISLDPFMKMARRAFSSLAEASPLKTGGGLVLPPDLLLQLPSESGYRGWIQLLYQTARCYSTPLLSAEPGSWGCTGQPEDDKWTTTGYPAHPFYEELRYDLFTSSAEAIRLWLNPAHAFCCGDCVAETPIRLPPEPEENGPVPPNKLWLWGKCYEFSPTPWRLLECLWGKGWVSIEDAIRHVYGESEGQNADGAINAAKKRLAHELGEQNCPAEVRRKQEHLILDVFNPD